MWLLIFTILGAAGGTGWGERIYDTELECLEAARKLPLYAKMEDRRYRYRDDVFIHSGCIQLYWEVIEGWD